MWNLFRAEWKKTTGNRWLVGCLIGIWPLVAIILSFVVAAVYLTNDSLRQEMIDQPTSWTSASLFFWTVPNSVIGRILIIGFAATLFAGEYQWGTWKHLLPRRGRIILILMKFVTLGVFIVGAFTLTSIIWVIGRGLGQLAIGSSYPPSLGNIPSEYWSQLGAQILLAFTTTLIIAAVAGLAALLTRSVLASVIISLVFAIFDGIIAMSLLIMFIITDQRNFLELFRFTLGYNTNNVVSWVEFGHAEPLMETFRMEGVPLFGDIVLDPPIQGSSLGTSLLVLGVWLIVLVCLSIYSFYRQDVVS